MSRKKKKPSRIAPSKWTLPLIALLKPSVLKTAAAIALLITLASATVYGTVLLDRHVQDILIRRQPSASPVFVDLSPALARLALADLQTALFPVLDGDWTDGEFCRRAAQAVASVPWVKTLNYARRDNTGRLEVSCTYRIPAALVKFDLGFYLVDEDAVRLPGRFGYDQNWPVIQGGAEPPPEPGVSWPGTDLPAALATLALIRSEPYADQIRAIHVENHEGRLDPRRPHILLGTDRPGGRIAWGSRPGMEIEENTAAQKMAILRENFAQTGRCDAGFPGIDVSTFPDRFQVFAEADPGT